MALQSNSAVDGTPPRRGRVSAASRRALLAAGRECLLDIGVRRTTLSEVARRAGTSRMTVYRCWPDVGALLSDVLTTSMSDTLAVALAAAGSGTGRRRLVNAVCEVVERLWADPLVDRILELDPEALLPFVTQRLGSSQRVALSTLTALIADGQADGSVRVGDPGAAALTVLLAAQSLVLSGRVVRAAAHRGPVLGELRAMLDGYLSPVRPARRP